ncbi:Rv2175c family DNA-binding protein [Zhihengliuella sp.]|uniref:Rv2175c family DNA-binding protein n=1 Tax=Zhihengliuella sp. TaxID=1954483 RepID=UPI00281169F9|nr:Rv2175c family DNA-binding protein [Zhihengliuella sp.]
MNNVEELVGDWMALPDVAEALDLNIRQVHTLIRERALIEHRVGGDRIRAVPAAFLMDGKVLDSVKGTASVLADAGYTDEEALRWLFTEDESLPGRPIDALRSGRKTEIRRRAQALAW